MHVRAWTGPMGTQTQSWTFFLFFSLFFFSLFFHFLILASRRWQAGGRSGRANVETRLGSQPLSLSASHSESLLSGFFFWCRAARCQWKAWTGDGWGRCRCRCDEVTSTSSRTQDPQSLSGLSPNQLHSCCRLPVTGRLADWPTWLADWLASEGNVPPALSLLHHARASILHVHT